MDGPLAHPRVREPRRDTLEAINLRPVMTERERERERERPGSLRVAVAIGSSGIKQLAVWSGLFWSAPRIPIRTSRAEEADSIAIEAYH